MCHLDFITARSLLGCCCCSSSDDFEGEGEGGEEGRKKKSMELAAPRFQFWGNNDVNKEAGGRRTPTRLPSTRLSSGRPLSPAPSIVASLSTTIDPAALPERSDLAFTAGAKVIPHPAKKAKGGEDAYFISSSYKGGVLGVADGVSGWAEENVDPALFSKELMAHALAAVGTEEVSDDPRQLLAKAHSETLSVGAATAIVAILDRTGILHVANLGDCGLRIVRQGKVVFATAPQQHYFDCPYQLSSENAQTAADAVVYELGVLQGDIIVMGSDGLFDNVFDYDIESAIGSLDIGGSDEDLASRTARALANLACRHAKDRNFDSPYAKEAVLQGYDLPWWRKVLVRQRIGGKVDDITVVVGHVVSSPISVEDETPSFKEDKAEDVEIAGHVTD